MDRFRILHRWLVAFLPFCWALGVSTGLAAENTLTYADAVRFALKNNHEIKAMQNTALAAKEGVGVARGRLLPRISFEERFLRTVNPGYAFMTKLNQERIESSDFMPSTLNRPDPINDFQTSLILEQPIFTRKGLLGMEMSRTDARLRDEETLRKREDVVFQVTQAVLSLQTARAFAGAAEKAVEEAKEHLRITEVRHKAGLGQYADTLRAATALTEAEQRKISAEKNLRVARRGIGLHLGMETDVDIADAVPEIAIRELNDYSQSALSRRDVKSVALREENARKNIKMAEAGYFPYVGVGGTYQLNDHSRLFGSEGNNWQVMAVLRWDLFDGTKREYERAKAQYEAAGAQEQLAALKKAISFRIYEAFLSIEETGKNVALARQAVQSAEEGKRLVRLRYEGGLYPLVDLLTSQASLDQARANLAAREGEHRLARVRLSHEGGTIMTDLKIEE